MKQIKRRMERAFISLMLIVSLIVVNVMNIPMLGYSVEEASASETTKDLYTTSKAVNIATGSAINIKDGVYFGDGYEVRFKIDSQWKGSFNGSITITNTGDYAIDNWILKFAFGHEITNIWNAAIIKHENGVYTIKNDKWNQDIPINGTVSFGFTAACEEKIQTPEAYSMIQKKMQLSPKSYATNFSVYSDWGYGYTAAININNLQDQAIEDWIMEFDFDGTIYSIWNAEILSHEGKHYVIKNRSYNQNIASGSSLTFGFQGSPGNLRSEPTNIKLFGISMNTAVNNDNDNDGIENDKELKLGLDPDSEDTDSDGLPDGYELYTLYPLLLNSGYKEDDGINSYDDYDKDRLTNIEEYLAHTNPGTADTDGDGLSDFDEINQYGTNPTLLDTDNDSMGDATEVALKLNPLITDTDSDGIPDSAEKVSQIVSNPSFQKLDINETEVLPSLKFVGTGDYSQKITAEDISYDAIYKSMDFIVGHPFNFKHDSSLSFDSSTLTFTISQKALKANQLKDLIIVAYDEANHQLEFLNTKYDTEQNTVSADVSHYSDYFVMNLEKFLNFDDSGLKDGTSKSSKADIVFVINRISSSKGVKENVYANINQFLDKLKENNIDVQLKVVVYQTIPGNDEGDKEVYNDWCTDIDSFREEINNLGNKPDHYRPLSEALEYARNMNFRSDASKHIINITDFDFLLGSTEADPHLDEYSDQIVPLSIETEGSSSGEGTVDDGIVYSEVDNEEGAPSRVIVSGGVSSNINGPFAEDLGKLIKIISEDSGRYTVRLTNGTVVKLKKNPLLNDDTVDTDGDGIPDIIELGQKTEINIVSERDANGIPTKYITLTAWTFRSNPAIADTDGDGLIDSEDRNPTRFDLYVKEVHGDNVIELSSGALYCVYDLGVDLDEFFYSYRFRYVEIFQKDILEALKARLDINSDMDYTVEEAAYLCRIDINGMTYYMHDKDSSFKQKVYECYTGIKVSEKDAEELYSIPSFGEAWDYYSGVAGDQLINGKAAAATNTLGTVEEIGMAFIGADALTDVGNLSYDIKNWEPSWEHLGETTIDGISLLPVVGFFTKGKKLLAISKVSDNLFVVKKLKNLDKIITSIDGAKYLSKSIELADTAKNAMKSLGSKMYQKVLNTLEGTQSYRLAFAGAGVYDNILIDAIIGNADDLKYIENISPELASDVLKDVAVKAAGKNADDIEKTVDEALDTAKKTADGLKVAAEAIYSKIKNIISKIPNSLKVNGKCDGFAKKLVEGLQEEGIKYEIIRIDSTHGIYSDKARDSIGQGFHYGIKIDNMIYDNMTLNGMEFNSWLTDLGADGSFKGITWKTTTEILNK